jgi:hypothetical protein
MNAIKLLLGTKGMGEANTNTKQNETLFLNIR